MEEPTSRGLVRAVIYVRIPLFFASEGDLAELSACQDYAQAHNLVPVLVLKDREDARALDRPGLTALRAVVQSGAVDAVVIPDLERLSYNAADQDLLRQEIHAAGVALHILPMEQYPKACRLINQLLETMRIHHPGFDEHWSRRSAAPEEALLDGAIMCPCQAAGIENARLFSDERPWVLTREKRAAIYMRVVDVGGLFSAEQQFLRSKREARGMVRVMGYTLVGTFEDWVEGDDLDRPGLNALREVIAARLVDVLYIGSWRMLAPHPATIQWLRREFIDAGCTVVSRLNDMPKA